MNKLNTFISRFIMAGTNDSQKIMENGIIKLVNIISSASILILFLVSLLEFRLPGNAFLYNIVFMAMFFIPVYLNHQGKYEAATKVLLSLYMIAIYIGTFVMKFTGYFHFTIILPNVIYFILSPKITRRNFIILIAITLIYIVIHQYQEIRQQAEITTQDFINAGVYILTILVILFTNRYFFVQLSMSRNKVQEQLRLEKAIACLSQIMIADQGDRLSTGLEVILKASNVSRVYVFQLDADKKHVSQTHECCAPGVECQINNPLLQHIPLSKFGFDRWLDALKNRNSISGLVKDFPEAEKEILVPQGIKSIMVVPIFSGKDWIGFIGYDDVEEERVWKEENKHLLSTTADIIGLHLTNIRYKKEIIAQNEDLKELNSTKDKFFSIVAHDLSNPFNSLLGFSTLMEDELEGTQLDTLKKYASFISKGLTHTFEYLNNLLEWSRIQTNRKEFLPSDYKLNDLLNEAVDFTLSQAQKKDITIHVNSADNLHAFIDKNMINTVVVNLLSNAIKYSYIGSEINLNGNLDDEYVIISIQDFGIGISTEQSQKLFNINNSKSTPGTMDEIGTGLGLIICKEFIDLHKGTIGLKSQVSKGSTFYFSIPIQPVLN